MKKLFVLSVIAGLFAAENASAADITIYHSPSCPHCHHAREFIASTLIYEYPELKVTEVDVTKQGNMNSFREALKKCEFTSGGVPVLVIGDKCEQGFADFMQDDLRKMIEVDLSEEQKATAAENKKALEADAESFKSQHAERTSAIVEYVADVETTDAQKKNSDGSLTWLYGLMVILVAGLGYLLVRTEKKK